MTKGKIITFYSYKGGVGRTMSLANIATILALWNKKVLIIDWDLEAPGLEKYFINYASNRKLGKKGGIIDILIDKASNNKVSWKHYLQEISISNKYKIKYLGSGKIDDDYFNKIKQLDIDSLYENNYGFEFFEGLRNEWKSEFDFILIDSRTGITDIGGICTIQLPDIVLVFINTNEQSLLGSKEIIERINLSQQSQPYDRQNLIIFPILCKFDTTTEFEISQFWIKKVSDALKSIYNDWLPLKVERKEFIEKTKIPYIPYFSFGEKLSVIEQGFSDPSSMGHAYESLASIIVNNFENIGYFISHRNSYIFQATKTYNLTSFIKIIGVGGGGCSAVNHMYRKGIKDVGFVVCNTDVQTLDGSPVSVKIQLGESLTEGRGAGSKPEIGKHAAIENLNDVAQVLSQNTKMVFVTAGMGGGTGTGAAPVIAGKAKEMGILTVAIVTMPFLFEGPERFIQATEGINELKDHVDSLLVINNEKLREIYGNLKVSNAFEKADDVIAIAAKGIAEIITVPGFVNVDFEDVQTLMKDSGIALMGWASAAGEKRAINAIQEALCSPLFNNSDISVAKNIFLNITYGTIETSMDEIAEITNHVHNVVSIKAIIIWGISFDESLSERISVTIIATGFETSSIPELKVQYKIKDKQSEPSNEKADVFENKHVKEQDIKEEWVINELENEPAYLRKKIRLERKEEEKRDSSNDVMGKKRDHKSNDNE